MLYEFNDINKLANGVLFDVYCLGYSITINKHSYSFIEKEYVKKESDYFKYYLQGKDVGLIKNIFDIEREEVILKFAAILNYNFQRDDISNEQSNKFFDDFLGKIIKRSYPSLIKDINGVNSLSIRGAINRLESLKENVVDIKEYNMTTLGENDMLGMHILIIYHLIASNIFGTEALYEMHIDENENNREVYILNHLGGIFLGLNGERINSIPLNCDIEKVNKYKDLVDKAFIKNKITNLEYLINFIEMEELSIYFKDEINSDDFLNNPDKYRIKLHSIDKALTKYLMVLSKVFKCMSTTLSAISYIEINKDDFDKGSIMLDILYSDRNVEDSEIAASFANLLVNLAFKEIYNKARNIYLYSSKEIELEKYIKLKDSIERKYEVEFKKLKSSENEAKAIINKNKRLEEKIKALELENKKLINENLKLKEEHNEVVALRDFLFRTSSQEVKLTEEVFKSDYNSLKNKRIIFFGGNSNLHSKLKETLNKATFIDISNVSFDVNIIKKADKVVIHTDYLAHAVYYKIMVGINKYNVDIVFINRGTNIENILDVIEESFK